MNEDVAYQLRRLEHGEPRQILEAAKRLESLNLDITSGLLALLGAADRAETRAAAAYVLGFARCTIARPDLEERVRDRWEEPNVRGHAAEALGYIGHPGSIPSLVDALDDDHDCVRYWCIFALGQIGDREGLGVLTGLVDQLGEAECDGRSLRQEAIDAITEIRRRLNDREELA
jgi:HEAT repeat protein